jgi:hypothetical protein
MSMSTRIEYKIKSADGSSQSFLVDVNPESFVIKDDDTVEGPAWTLLENNQCEHCPFNKNEKKYCPVAKNLAQASEAFKDHRSVDKVTVFVKTEERFYGKDTDLQTALFSLFGLTMASSNCSHLHIFKSMARFHLPFSTLQETTVRALGMYLISEYLVSMDKKDHKIEMQGLLNKYDQIAIVNRGIIERIRSLKGGDANKNAIVVLDNFASLLPLEISSGLSEIKPLFNNLA